MKTQSQTSPPTPLAQRARTLIDWGVPIVLLVVVTVVIRLNDIDMIIASRLFFGDAYWAIGGGAFWKFLENYGTWPGLAVTYLAFVVFIASFLFRRVRAHRMTGLFFVLVMIFGPGLVVNVVFKQNYGRPRPWDIREFGGDKAFVEVWSRPNPGIGNSFPSGHASSGFYFMAPFFVLRRRRLSLAVLWLLIGLGYGGLMGTTRMVQGAHFLSDVVWSAGFVYLTALAFTYILRLER